MSSAPLGLDVGVSPKAMFGMFTFDPTGLKFGGRHGDGNETGPHHVETSVMGLPSVASAYVIAYHVPKRFPCPPSPPALPDGTCTA
jgi:hypothetical protein